MGEVINFRRPRASEKHRGKGLCREGHHKWQADNQTRFDVKSGRLVTVQRCSRCGITRNRLT